MNTKMQSKNDYHENWEDLYLLTDGWKSDLEFYSNELLFITNAMNKNLVWLIQDGNIAKAQDNIKKLSDLKIRLKNIRIKLNNHLVQLEELMMNPFLPDNQEILGKHRVLEDQFYTFERNLRAIKKESFSITHYAFEEENLSYMLAF